MHGALHLVALGVSANASHATKRADRRAYACWVGVGSFHVMHCTATEACGSVMDSTTRVTVEGSRTTNMLPSNMLQIEGQTQQGNYLSS